MIAIPMREFQKLSLALPKCLICKPENGCSFIIDREGNKVGDVHWQIPQITIYEDYEYCNEVVEAIGKGKFAEPEEFKVRKQAPVEGDPPQLTDYGKQLYAPPETQDNAIT